MSQTDDFSFAMVSRAVAEDRWFMKGRRLHLWLCLLLRVDRFTFRAVVGERELGDEAGAGKKAARVFLIGLAKRGIVSLRKSKNGTTVQLLASHYWRPKAGMGNHGPEKRNHQWNHSAGGLSQVVPGPWGAAPEPMEPPMEPQTPKWNHQRNHVGFETRTVGDQGLIRDTKETGQAENAHKNGSVSADTPEKLCSPEFNAETSVDASFNTGMEPATAPYLDGLSVSKLISLLPEEFESLKSTERERLRGKVIHVELEKYLEHLDKGARAAERKVYYELAADKGRGWWRALVCIDYLKRKGDPFGGQHVSYPARFLRNNWSAVWGKVELEHVAARKKRRAAEAKRDRRTQKDVVADAYSRARVEFEAKPAERQAELIAKIKTLEAELFRWVKDPDRERWTAIDLWAQGVLLEDRPSWLPTGSEPAGEG